MQHQTTERASGKREANKQDRRRAIIEVARRSFLDEGYAATSMSGLLKTLGGSKATLWSYFRSKEELFTAVIEDLTADLSEELKGVLLEPTGIEDALSVFCARFIDSTTLPDSVAAWRLIVGESGRFPELGLIFYEQAVVRVETALAAYLQDQIDAGRLHNEDAVEMARTLIGFCLNRQNKILLGVVMENENTNFEEAARICKYFMAIFARQI
jgi:TetR/AcrR family transcriptional repressor of mexJK operon